MKPAQLKPCRKKGPLNEDEQAQLAAQLIRAHLDNRDPNALDFLKTVFPCDNWDRIIADFLAWESGHHSLAE